MSLTITIPGAVNATTGATAPATLTVGVGTPGATGPAGPAGAGVPAGGTAGQFLQKIDGVSYNTDWVTLNLSSYAPLASPALTGTPTAPTATTGDSSTQIATTAFVQDAVIAGSAHAETLQATVRNNTGATLAPFTVVYINGALGNQATVAKAQANAESTSAGTFAVTQASIANNANGVVISAGVLSNIDTSAFADGDKLYLSPTTAGGVTTTKPSAPNHLVYVGVVTRSHPTLGTVSVRIQNGYELGEIHDVALTSVTDNDLLAYESASGLWKNESFTSLGLLTSASAASTYYLASNPSGYITSSALSPYLTSATAASTYQTQAGMSSYLTTASAASTYYLQTNPAGYITSSALSTYAPLASPALTGTPTAPTALTADNSTTIATTAFVKAQGYLTSAPVTSVAGRTGAVTLAVADVSGAAPLASPTFTGTVTIPAGASISGYASLAGATFTGLVTTPAATTTTAGLNVPHGAAPTTPVNGDVWTTTAGLFARINGGTQQYAPLGSTNTFTGTNTFSGATVSVGTSTAASTYNIGTGATLTATTKAINIGTNGVSGSTTNITIGNSISGATSTTTVAGTLNASGTSLDLGNSTAASTINLGAGATISGATKTVNIGTNGVVGSTNIINIGPSATSGTVNFTNSTVNLGSSANATTQAQNTNTTALATTAFVLGQASSTTPVVDGTAAVGTATTFARADHVHPTDTSRAPLASPTFTGVPAAPTAAVDTNTTQLATTAYVVGQGYAKLASPTLTGTPAAPTAAVDTNTTQLATTAYVVGQGYAKLASPSLTGTPVAPTAAANTNTTQIATTAFVLGQAATEAQALAGTSSTTTISPLVMRAILANAGYTTYSSLMSNYSSFGSGAGAFGLSIYSDFFSPYVTAVNGKSAFAPSSTININSFQSRGKAELLLDWTKPMWFSFRFHFPTGGTGDSNTVCRVSIGKTASTFGDLSSAGFGVKWVGGTTGAFTIMAHNGTTLTTSASAVTVSNTTYFPSTTSAADFLVYSDGAGNITLFCNGTQVATTTGGPSSGTVTQGRFLFEADNTTTFVSLCAPTFMGVRSLFAY